MTNIDAQDGIRFAGFRTFSHGPVAVFALAEPRTELIGDTEFTWHDERRNRATCETHQRNARESGWECPETDKALAAWPVESVATTWFGSERWVTVAATLRGGHDENIHAAGAHCCLSCGGDAYVRSV
jgi:hypothetical protein